MTIAFHQPHHGVHPHPHLRPRVVAWILAMVLVAVAVADLLDASGPTFRGTSVPGPQSSGEILGGLAGVRP